MYTIDVHAHVFPDKIAEKAIPALAAAADVKPSGTGTCDDLLKKMNEANAKISVLVSIATRIEQVKSINDWLLKQASERFVPFAAIHPGAPDYRSEIERVKKLGFRGFKVHPNYQNFYPDDEHFIEVARAIADAGLILLTHGGVDWAYEEVNAAPERIARLMDAVPELTLVIAHFGGFQKWDEVETILAGSNAYFDISFTLPYIEKEQFVRIARKHGIGRLLFGSDYPWADAAEQTKLLKQLPFTDEELAAILHKNAEQLLGLK